MAQILYKSLVTPVQKYIHTHTHSWTGVAPRSTMLQHAQQRSRSAGHKCTRRVHALYTGTLLVRHIADALWRTLDYGSLTLPASSTADPARRTPALEAEYPAPSLLHRALSMDAPSHCQLERCPASCPAAIPAGAAAPQTGLAWPWRRCLIRRVHAPSAQVAALLIALGVQRVPGAQQRCSRSGRPA